MSIFSAFAKLGEIIAPIEKDRTFLHDYDENNFKDEHKISHNESLESIRFDDQVLSSSSTLTEGTLNEIGHHKKGKNEQSHSYSLGYEGRQSQIQTPQKARDNIVTSGSEQKKILSSF